MRVADAAFGEAGRPAVPVEWRFAHQPGVESGVRAGHLAPGRAVPVISVLALVPLPVWPIAQRCPRRCSSPR